MMWRADGRALVGLAVLPLLALPLVSVHVAGRSADPVTRFTDPEIIESSGLVVEGDTMVTVNDSGDRGRVFTVDARTGATVGVTSWEPEPEDVEALAPAGPGHVWVADIGDNRARREWVSVRRVPVGVGARVTGAPEYRWVYPDGPHDAEALLADPGTGRLYVVTKSVFGGQVFAAPRRLSAEGPSRLRPVAADVLGLVTDGAFLGPGVVALRNYGQAEFYSLPGWEPIERIDLPSQQQGEGLAAGPDRSIWLSSEGSHSPVLRVPLPESVRAALQPPAATASPTPAGAPESGGQESGGGAEGLPAVTDQEPTWRLLALVALGGLVAVGLAVAWSVRERRRRGRQPLTGDQAGGGDAGQRRAW